MASAFDDLATKIPKGDMGSRDPSFVTDFLGRQAPLSFSGQPALPSSGSPTPSAGPSGPSGTGAVGEKGATGLLATPGGATPDLSGSVAGAGGGGGSEGPAGTAVSETGSMPSSFDLASFNLADLGVTGPFSGVGARIGPTGTLSPTTGNKTLDSVVTTGAKLAGVPVTANLLSVVAQLTGLPVLGMLASTVGVAGLPLALVSLAHAISTNVPGTIASNINTIASNPNITEEDFNSMMAQVAQGFPMTGGPQGVSGVPGSLQGPQGAAFGLDFSNPSVRSGFEANQPSTARTDVGVPSATAEGPGISGAPPGGAIGAGAPGAGLGEGGPGGPGPGAPSDGATGGGTDAGEA